ncbi:MAG: hypothetical protein KF799_12680 [Bdellovibrionales bacterium]|nr:hypothetical protein [Bdellovibrionales bacterium]
MSEVAKSITVVEVAHASEMQEDLRRKLKESQKLDGSRIDSVRATVLSSVVSESYDRAKDDLRAYVEHKASYPAFQVRVERHVEHCCDLIEAIKTKRNFPGLASLSLSKQQELHERVLEHFEELKQNLKHVEKVERDHKLTDVRSTVWVLKTLSFTVAAVMAVAFFIEVNSGMLMSSVSVAQGLLDDASTWVVGYLPFLH